MRLTKANYFSAENNMKYMSASQFKSFLECEARTLAELRGEYVREETTALLVGSYVDAYFSNELAEFKSSHPEIFTRQGELKSDYRHAEEIIQRILRDKMFMKYMSGRKQVIKTGKIAGVPFKIKMDSYHKNKAIVDMKIMKDFEPVWKEGKGKLHFIEAWGYDMQGAIYQAVEGNQLPFILAAATKEKVTDLQLISVSQEVLDVALEIVEEKAQYFQELKKGLHEPERCGHCDYCKQTKVLTGEIPIFGGGMTA